METYIQTVYPIQRQDTISIMMFELLIEYFIHNGAKPDYDYNSFIVFPFSGHDSLSSCCVGGKMVRKLQQDVTMPIGRIQVYILRNTQHVLIPLLLIHSMILIRKRCLHGTFRQIG